MFVAGLVDSIIIYDTVSLNVNKNIREIDES